MHDANGRALEVKDLVLIPARIEDLSPQEDFCNVGVCTTLGRRPDAMKERVSAINTGVMLKAAAGYQFHECEGAGRLLITKGDGERLEDEELNQLCLSLNQLMAALAAQ